MPRQSEKSGANSSENAPICGPCASCDMRCCAHFAIPLTIFDVGRICQRTGMRAQEFCALAESEKVEQPQHANIFIFDNTGQMSEKTLVLAKTNERRCVFFKNGKGCSIHGAHPMPCRAYPFVPGENGMLRQNRHFVCPRKWRAGEWNEKEVGKILDEFASEVARHDKIVREWNARHSQKEKGKAAQEKFFTFIQGEINAGL